MVATIKKAPNAIKVVQQRIPERNVKSERSLSSSRRKNIKII